NIRKVLLNGLPVPYQTDSAGLTVRFPTSLDWNKTYKLQIDYDAAPRKGIYFIGWNVNDPNTTQNRFFTRKQIWTQGQGIDNRHWIPCYDDVNDKLITETIITFDSSYTVISNGVLKSKKNNGNGTFTWHYAMSKPMVPYLIMIAIDKYAYRDYKSKNGMVSRQFYYANKPYEAEPTYQYSAEMMDWLCNELQVPYPWETYCNVPVQDFMYGAMENTTATIFGDFLLTDKRGSLERSYIGTNAHELTHQWFGDYITEYSAQHHWLHESFATYYAKHFLAHIKGQDYLEWLQRGEAVQAIYADKTNRYPVAHSQGGTARHYPKGSFVIDMLRYVVGDSVFKRCITHYLKKHAYANVTNYDFQMAFMEAAGINLDWFFDQWIYRAGYPDFQVFTTANDSQVVFIVHQNQTSDLLQSYFQMPVILELYLEDGSVISQKRWIRNQTDTFALPTGGKRVLFPLFDAGSHILKTINFKKTTQELCAQALRAKHMIDRYDALTDLRIVPLSEKRQCLLQVIEREKFNGVKNEAVKQLLHDTNALSIAAVKKCFTDPDWLVRKGCIEELDSIPVHFKTEAEQLLRDTSYYTIEYALRKLCKSFPEEKNRYLEIVKNEWGAHNNIRIARLEILLKDLMNIQTDEFRELADFTSNKYEFVTRVKAMEAIERLGLANEEVLKNLMNGCTYTNNRINGPSSRVLKSLMKNPEYAEKAKAVFRLNTWKNWEEKILRPILGL
ncbi:MAG: M1 family metallopeptidase, partial [Chitinophagales bacterium]|nr:M1 family metallopeptidase [Chitinophagales bacterium]